MASVIISGDTSGAVTLSAPAVAGTNTVSLPANTGTAILDSSTPAYRNRIINGAMVIDQRNAGASVTPVDDGFVVDRFKFNVSQASKITAQQNQGSVTPPVGFKNYLGITSSSAYTVGASEKFVVWQGIEGFNVSDLAWGTANAKTITLSFQVYSSLTGTFGGSLANNGFNRAYPFTYTISSANTWTTVSVTIAGDTTGTWTTDNSIGIRVYFSLGTGSTYSGTAGSWANTGYFSATGATSVVGTNGATFYITGVQLEKGSTATSFDYRPYGTEFMLCQRYYQNLYIENVVCCRPQSSGTGSSQCYIPFLVQTRTTATIAFPQSTYSPNLGTPTAATSGTYPQNATNGVRVYSSTSATQNDTANLSCQMTVSAEL